jgi:hypothetical protein
MKRNCLFLLGILLAGMCLNAKGDDAPAPVAETQVSESSTWDWITRNFGINYNSFFYGPGLGSPLDLPPGMSGEPSDTGLNFFNLISVKWKVSDRFAADVQFRNQLVITKEIEYRHQGQRLGISGTFLKGDDWSFSGALNSDVPISAIMGQIPSERTLLINPGFFSFFSYAPKTSRWSLFALVAPRVWFYRDRQAVSRQDALNGGTVNKPEYTVFLNPSVNYALNDKVGLRFGTTLEYTKFVGFDSIRRNYMPIEFGVTYDISPMFSIYTYLYTSTPLDDGLREAQGFGGNSWWKTASLQVWLSGTLF